MDDLETVCEKAKIDRNYEKILQEKLIQSGFEKINHFLKRDKEDSIEYLFTEGITPNRDYLPVSKKSRLRLGTYYFTIPKSREKKFEKSVRRANARRIKIFGLRSFLAYSLTFAIDILRKGENFPAGPRQLKIKLLEVGGIYIPLIIFFYISNELTASYYIRKLKKRYIPNCQYSNNDFDYKIIKGLIDPNFKN